MNPTNPSSHQPFKCRDFFSHGGSQLASGEDPDGGGGELPHVGQGGCVALPGMGAGEPARCEGPGAPGAGTGPRGPLDRRSGGDHPTEVGLGTTDHLLRNHGYFSRTMALAGTTESHGFGHGTGL